MSTVTARIGGPHGRMATGILVVSALISACAGVDSNRNTSPLSSDCIVNRGVRDFDVLDDRNLIIYGPGNSAYQVEMATPSSFLRGEISIGILDRDGRICPYGGDAILIDGPLSERIPIRSIKGLTPGEVESLKVQYGLIEGAGDIVTVSEVDTE